MSLRFLFAGLAIAVTVSPVSAQLSEHPLPPFRQTLLNADNTTQQGATQDPSNSDHRPWLFSRGSVSIQELEHPLNSKRLNLLEAAQDQLKRGNTAAALDQLRAAAQDPLIEPYALSMLGSEHLKQGQMEAAYVELVAAVRLLPGLAANHVNLAIVLRLRGEPEQALIEARKALQLDPGRPNIRLTTARILLMLGRKEEAKYHLLRATEMPAARTLLAQAFGQ
ncbi:MAG: tetratricopeptide repeat protein [Acidobacteriota bacterium]